MNQYDILYTVILILLYSVFWIFDCIWLSLSDSLGQPVCESELYFSQFCCCCEFLPHISHISHGCMPAVSLQWQKVTVLYHWSITARGLCGQLEPLKDEGQTSQPCFFVFKRRLHGKFKLCHSQRLFMGQLLRHVLSVSVALGSKPSRPHLLCWQTWLSCLLP